MYNKFYIDYDRNMHKDGATNLADMLMSITDNDGKLFIDSYAIPDEIASLHPNHYVNFESSLKEPELLSRLLKYITPISAYVCEEVDSSQQLQNIWRNCSYSVSKIYRINNISQTARKVALDSVLREKFEWVSLDELSILLKTNVCLFRDYHDEIGLEILCLENMEQKIKHSMKRHLGIKYANQE